MTELTERERQIVAWLRNCAQMFHGLAVKDKHLRAEHIALASAYSSAANAIERGEPWGEQA